MNKKVEVFIKNWKDELRSRVQPIVKAGKRKPTVTIVRIGDTPDSGMMEIAKDIGFIGDLYQIPLDSGIAQEDLMDLVLQCDTDEVYVEEPLPEGFENPLITGRYMEKGILTFLKSQNIDPLGWRIILAFANDKYEAHIGDIVFYKEQVETLEQMAILEEGIVRAESE